ncbi:Nn.00g026990.m01.CDS01 [Neocucurbitaria sp. VM-36]
MAPYQYNPLNTDVGDIRLLTLLPGKPDEPICITIDHTSLRIPDPKARPVGRMTLAELQETLPPNWAVFSTLEGRYIFCNMNPETELSSFTSWRHPDARFEKACYKGFEDELEESHESRYEALSYVWGSTNNLEMILVVNNRSKNLETSTAIGLEYSFPTCTTLEVTSNLHCALLHLRNEDSPRTLWIDAICINQQDAAERGDQVRRMRHIYSLASRVVVWLGPEADTSTNALSTLAHLGEQVENTQDRWFLPVPQCQQPSWYRAKLALPYGDETWQSITRLFERPWFQRLWVFQEIRLANRNAIVQCGSYEILWSLFTRAVMSLDYKIVKPTSLRNILPLVYGIVDSKHTTTTTESLLVTGWYQQCAHPLDKVYGLLSLAPVEYAKRIRPNYSKAVSAVYQEAFLADNETTQRIELLRYCSSDSRSIGLPSWVPDWSAPVFTKFPKGQNASGYSAAHARQLHDDRMEVSGVLCAFVGHVSELVPTDISQIEGFIITLLMESNNNNAQDNLEVYGDIFTLGRHRHRYPETLSFPSLHEARETLSSYSSRKLGHFLDAYQRLNIGLTCGRTFLQTVEGHIGLGPPGARSGDQVCVILGCGSVLLLRPSSDGCFLVVGDCYIPDFNDAKALLGPLPEPWSVQLRQNGDNRSSFLPQFFNSETQNLSEEDPRLGKLPYDWEKFDRGWEYGDPENAQWYRNTTTGEIINSDPRMSPEALEARGAKVQTITLI